MSAGNSMELYERLEEEAARRNDLSELSPERPDPLSVARALDDDRAILLCALFGYGNAKRIVEFLERIDFSLLEADEGRIRTELAPFRYRFQSSEDIVQIFLTLGRMEQSLEEIFMEGYTKNRAVIEGVFSLIRHFERSNVYESRGYRFLIGRIPENGKPVSPYKRWMMFLRWMVRKDALDLGRWSGIDTADLIIPLDTHTFRVGRRLGLLRRKTYDWKAAVELTEALKDFSPDDPVKYDFALYRLGQERGIS